MPSLFLSDEEMGKKDDDHQPKKTNLVLRNPVWSPAARVPPRKALKRFVVLVLVAAAVYLFIHNIPTDLGVRDRRHPTYIYPEDRLAPSGDHSVSAPKPPPAPSPPKLPRPLDPPPKPDPVETEDQGDTPHEQKSKEPSENTYNGPVRFLKLAASLHSIGNTNGGYWVNKNVLFAASSLKSAATLLPLACQMGMELRSYVHFALMSRSDIDVEQLREINGIDDACEIIFHDARPDYSTISTVPRLGHAVSRAMYHLHTYVHPQAIIVDGSDAEETFFTDSVWEQAGELKIPLIDIPEHGANKLPYLSKLDSASLAAWSKTSFDILIHASPGASGSLIRLLRSLSKADFTASSVPHLTIELPQHIDAPTNEFLKTFQWPPNSESSPSTVQQLSLRHRIPQHGISEEESSVRFLESFWPANPRRSHVLVLSPQVELSRNFFHYLKYMLLEYRYSNAAALQEWDKRLFGLSLDLPSLHLNTSAKFSPPSALDLEEETEPTTRTSDTPTSFLWQAPNSNAILILGEQWVELHGFVSRMLDVQSKRKQLPRLLSEKLVSKLYPSWLEHALRLCQARGYWTLYPSPSISSFLASVHNELYKAPEEYEKELPRAKSDESTEVILAPGSFFQALPNRGTPPPFHELPLLTWDGTKTNFQKFNATAADYATEFRRQVGQCTKTAEEDTMPDPSAADLFCLDDEDEV